ncbi:MAG TPA: type II secretion system protein GspG [Candidatus Margulisiibacteriota bacterium]|nr:type II secretion system protein GspG [Candidatus Margulisiibacteriota bacterium]
MKKARLGVLLLTFILYYTPHLLADTITLKTGERITGKIILRTERYVKLQNDTGSVIYFMDGIANISSDDTGATTEHVLKAAPEAAVKAGSEEKVNETVVSQPEAINEPRSLKPTFKTAKIIYEVTENMPPYERRIQRIVYIDTVNNRRRDEETEIFVPGKLQDKRDELNIFDGKKYYHIDLAKGVATYLDYSKEGNFYSWIDDAAFSDANPVGSEEILGKRCRVYDAGQIRTWSWNGLILKQISRNENSYSSLSATNIEENLPLSEDIFKLPDSIKTQLVQGVIQKPTKTYSRTAVAVVPPEQENINTGKAPAEGVSLPVSAAQIPDKDIEKILKNQQGQKGDLRNIDFTKMLSSGEESKKEVAKVDLEDISTALELYKVDNGKYPTTSQGLKSLAGTYLGDELKDPWGRAYRYISPAEGGKDYELYSAGADGIDGNADDLK